MPNDFDTMVIRMERWPGMPVPRSPPQYSIEIHGNGLTVFEGRLGAKVQGKRKGRITPKKAKWLLSEMIERGFFSMASEMPIPTVRDIPTTSVSVRIGSVERTALDELEPPKELVEIEGLIDHVGGTKRWLQRRQARRGTTPY